jgi:predicted GIY-YIG superfamily endonuclease
MNLARKKQLVQRSIGRHFENKSCSHTPNKYVCKLCVAHKEMTVNEKAMNGEPHIKDMERKEAACVCRKAAKAEWVNALIITSCP